VKGVSLAELVAEVADLGLEPELAEAYVQLTLSGPSAVADLGRALRTNRADVYRRLQRLEHEGLLVRVVGKPSLYAAVPPEELLDRIESTHRRAADRVHRTRGQLSRLLARAAGSGTGTTPGPLFQLVYGRARTQEALVRLFMQAKDEVIGASLAPGSLTVAERGGILRLLAEPRLAQIRKRAIFLDVPEVRERMHDVLEIPRIEARLIATDRPLRFAVADGATALLFIVGSDSMRLSAPDEVALWSDAPLLVSEQMALFELLWERARPVVK
jgi:sugar-specific transcriptional regulator TrmB